MDKSKYSDADGDFSNAPYFNFNDDKLKFNTNSVDNPNENYGSASAFAPKSLLKKNVRFLRTFLVYDLVERIQPPSILPISSIRSSI